MTKLSPEAFAEIFLAVPEVAYWVTLFDATGKTSTFFQTTGRDIAARFSEPGDLSALAVTEQDFDEPTVFRAEDGGWRIQ